MPKSRPVGWPSIVTIYLYTVLSMATVGVVVALTLDFSTALSVSQKDIGLAIAMFSLPSALFATVGGSVIDRVGAKPAMIASAAVCVLADLTAAFAGSTLVLNVALLLAGIGFAGISVAGPAMIVVSVEGTLRVKAMSLWSTYAPTGFALGLLVGAPFAGKAHWQAALGVHGAMTAAMLACGFLLPARALAAAQPAVALRRRMKDLGAAVTDIPVLRLAVASALPSAISYGTSLVAPSYLARVHDVGMGASSTTVALAKAVAMVICGLVMGQILARRINRLALYIGLCVAGILAQVAIFYPEDSFALAIGGLIVWLLVYGAAAAVCMALLPTVIRDPAHSGAASGLTGQFISVFSFMAPAIYFGMPGWVGFIAVAAVGMAVSLIALPVWKARAAVAVA